MPDREIAERHGRRERKPCLIADLMLSRRREIARCVKPGDWPAPLVDDLAVAVRKQPDRGRAGRMQLNSIERRLLDGAEAGTAAARRLGGGKLPLVLAAAEIGVRA